MALPVKINVHLLTIKRPKCLPAVRIFSSQETLHKFLADYIRQHMPKPNDKRWSTKLQYRILQERLDRGQMFEALRLFAKQIDPKHGKFQIEVVPLEVPTSALLAPWIPVHERMPEDMELLLLMDHSYTLHLGWYNPVKQRWYEGSGEYVREIKRVVTHWRNQVWSYPQITHADLNYVQQQVLKPKRKKA